MLRNLRVLFLLLFCCSSFLCSFAQTENVKRGLPNLPTFDEQRLRYGFLLGINMADFRVTNSGARTAENNYNARYAEVNSIVPGLNVGVVANLRLAKRLDLRFSPGINFAQRNVSFIDEKGKLDENSPLQIKSTYLEFPFLLKYSAHRINNFKPFLVGGTCIRYDLAKNRKDGILLNSVDYCLEFGAGFDSYMNYFRLTTEFRMSIGMGNIINKKGTADVENFYYTQAIDRLTSRIFLMTFYFQ